MIELSSLHIKRYDSVIEARNKVYTLVLDLEARSSVATRLSSLVSEILRSILKQQKTTNVKLAFTKSAGNYYCCILISCAEETYSKFKDNLFFKDVILNFQKHDEPVLEIKLKIMNKQFIPNDDFLTSERERLIQQSGTEMLQEIKRKNKELSKAINDLKSSSNMIQTEKMRALGGLTAGVAHELNNPMMGILNFIQYAIKHTDEDDRKYNPLLDAEREIRRCQSIIDNLLTFSRLKAEGEENFSEDKLSSLCERILQLYSYKIRSANINVIKNFPTQEPTVHLKTNKFQQVILNFVTNAIDAMRESKKRDLTFSVVDCENKIELHVADSGPGIDEETMDKIFDPFFTTKETGQGTGLGLAVSQSIIEEHNGTLKCQSTLGQGTCFTVGLPLLNDSCKK